MAMFLHSNFMSLTYTKSDNKFVVLELLKLEIAIDELSIPVLIWM